MKNKKIEIINEDDDCVGINWMEILVKSSRNYEDVDADEACRFRQKEKNLYEVINK